ncbi:MAG: hypothetical protein ACLUEQ_02385 [Cloacibacillus evryensis]
MEELAGQTGEEAPKGRLLEYFVSYGDRGVGDNAYLSRIYEGVYSIIEQGMSMMRINTSPEAPADA